MEDKREYRIPKHIEQRMKILGLDTTGMIVVGTLAALSLIILLVTPHHHLKSLFIEFVVLAGIPLGAWVFFSDDRFTESVLLSVHYFKNKAVLRWESEPNAILETIKKSERKEP
ncbi:hypothetical protein ACOALA_20615 (plasmid) [Alicyclobacillus acidoterrestris]|uniref:hypothetical protein n=1 Tax=Alicyclobacillus acidoterrestris TaxID=1450 RepID=UPI003F53A771